MGETQCVQGEDKGIRSENTQASVLALRPFWLNDLGVSHLSSSNLSFPIRKMEVHMFLSIQRSFFFFRLSHPMSNSSADPDSPFRMCPESGHLSLLSHCSRLGPLELGRSSSILLTSLQPPLPPSYNSHQSSQSDPARSFRSGIIYSKPCAGEKVQVLELSPTPQRHCVSVSQPCHSVLAVVAAGSTQQAPLPQGLPMLCLTPAP